MPKTGVVKPRGIFLFICFFHFVDRTIIYAIRNLSYVLLIVFSEVTRLARSEVVRYVHSEVLLVSLAK